MSKVVRRVSRIGVLGDVHAEDARLRRAYTLFDQQAVDAVLCVGDVVDGPGDADACIALLFRRGAHCVAGNHERWYLGDELRTLPDATGLLDPQHVDLLVSWPRTLDFDTPTGRLRLCHGVGEDDMVELRPDTRGYALQATNLRDLMLEPEIVYHVGGHTHVRMARAFPGLVALNPGTLTGDDPSAAIYDFAARTFAHYDVRDDALRLLESGVLPEPLPLV